MPQITHTKDEAAGLLKLLTLNTHKGFTSFNRRFVLHELREAVRGVAADIVFLQEVIGAHHGHAARHANWPAEPQYQFLAESIWGSVAYGCNAVYQHGDHGNAILSRYPIKHYRNHDISSSRMERRGILHSVIDAPQGQEIHVICTHLSLREAHRQRQFQQLCGVIASEVPPQATLFVAGDFNDWRGRAHPILLREAGLREAFIEAGGQAAASFPARWPMLQLDRIYFRNAGVLRCEVLRSNPWSRLSDHLPLYAEAWPMLPAP
ncbi:endonuclease/exonuclease/phosphatase family protein [Nevskia soli]|uniref:endonuclease/exonuclease/phosphatase family protein n=1 Tax=Nevskia soli TaxID=418856 RepID=UPI0004A72EE0